MTRRIASWLLIPTAWAGLAVMVGCKQQEPALLAALQTTWTTNDASGATEKVVFAATEVQFGHQTDKQYSCPYAIRSYYEARSAPPAPGIEGDLSPAAKPDIIELKMRCKKRIGVDAWVNYRLEFTPDRKQFVMLVEGRTVGIFTASET